MNYSLIYLDTPDLVNPYLIIGYRGWLNAGEIGTGCIDYLRRKLKARKFACLDSRLFYIWQVPGFDPAQIMRPTAVVEGGLVKTLDEPANDFFFWQSGGENDLILFTGFEPNLAWPEYTSAILSMARRYKACRIYILGGVYDQVPHTRDTGVYAVLSRPEMKLEFQTFPLLNYKGPCSFSTLLTHHAGQAGIEAASIVARVPPYIQTFHSKVACEFLQTVLARTSLNIDLSDLKKAGDAEIELMDKDFRQNKTALAQLRKLEEAFDTAVFQNSGYQEVSLDELMQEMFDATKDGRKPH